MNAVSTSADDEINISNPKRNMTITYVLSLSVIACLSIIVHLMLDRIIAEQNDTATEVNISGQQRMLSQRISLLTLEYLNTGAEEFKVESIETLNKMRSNHQFLLKKHLASLKNNQVSPMSEAMQNLYFKLPHNVDYKIKQFTALINESLKLNVDINQIQDKRFWRLAKTSLLQSLNTVVDQYESESLFKVNELRSAQQVVFVIILLTILIEALFIFRPMVDKVARYAERLQKEANFDHLTGLLNRRAFAMLAGKSVANCRRYKEPLSLLTFDIDHFKLINDTYGHDIGDKALQHISQIIKNSVRESDAVARFGGEEFVVLLPKTNEANAQLLAEKVRNKIETGPLTLEQTVINMTASCGVSEFYSSETNVGETLKRADEGLYKAKSQGRNRVCHG